MAKKRSIIVESYQTTEYSCDRCGKLITQADWIEWQEMIHIEIEGGYGSVFGDGERGALDLCQGCAMEIFGEFVQFDGRDEEQGDELLGDLEP